MEGKLKHLEIIQGVINRMASNSFFLKGWTIVFVSAVIGFVIKDSNPMYVLLAIMPAIGFWALDSFYLKQERLFRDLYDKVRKLDKKEIDFSMSTSEFQQSWFRVAKSNTILWFYLPIVIVVAGLMVSQLLFQC